MQSLGRPGINKFYTEARARGINISRETARSFAAGRPSNQMLAQRPRSNFKAVATDTNTEWDVDLLDKSAESSTGSSRYAMVVSDVHSREVHAVPLKSKTPQATAKALEEVINEEGDGPDVIKTDQGGEFRGAFAKEASDYGITQVRKDKLDINGTSVVDGAMGSLKRTMGSAQIATGKAWARTLGDAVHAFNNTGKKALLGSAPAEVQTNPQLGFLLQAKAGYDIQHNDKEGHKLAGRLETKGAFRTQLPRERDRQDKPKWSGEVHGSQKFQGQLSQTLTGTSTRAN
jgi:hypothetical protein